ncbi:MAG: hypothetical protein HZA29_01275 [Candidatus Omnitrophica bacterium]|nr:hypothetical protein [Candidatus Omnitrophota bacterium]
MVFSPVIPHHQIKRPVLWPEEFRRLAPLEVEIGFGLGEFLIRSAAAHPGRDYVGIEQHWERMHRTLERIAEMSGAGEPGSLRNVRVLKIDARAAFERLFVPETVDHVHCLFPCPWPKKGHVKHRLFSNTFLKLLNSRLKRGGGVTIVTDSAPYQAWIRRQLDATGFEPASRMVGPRYDTKFERKWHNEGHKEFHELVLTKTAHVAVPLKEDTPLQDYQLKEFDPKRFRFENQLGPVSVIFKEMLFDPVKDKAMVHLVVAEEEMTQHLWVAVVRRGKIWRVCKADGQSVLPTPGIARAIELVCEQARPPEARFARGDQGRGRT